MGNEQEYSYYKDKFVHLGFRKRLSEKFCFMRAFAKRPYTTYSKRVDFHL